MRISYLFFIVLFGFISCKGPSTKDEVPAKVAEATEQSASDQLPSWNEGASKKAIIDFVKSTTTEGSTSFIPVADRIACFDNDGTLWGEQPIYFQLAFALDQVKAMAPEHPEWKNKQPFKSVLDNDIKTLVAGGEKSVAAVMMASHSGMTDEVYSASVKQWMATAVHPKTGKHYNEMIYQPMVELLQYLRSNGYKTFIVSGGGIDFMRAWAEEAYGIPPYQIVGSSGGYVYDAKDSNDVKLVKQATINFIDDKEGKPVGIIRHIGKRPVFAGGNSDGDYAMLQYTSTGAESRFGMIVHHTDSVREVAYDRNSSIGKLSKGLDDAAHYKWLVVDMKSDWKKIYPYEK